MSESITDAANAILKYFRDNNITGTYQGGTGQLLTAVGLSTPTGRAGIKLLKLQGRISQVGPGKGVTIVINSVDEVHAEVKAKSIAKLSDEDLLDRLTEVSALFSEKIVEYRRIIAEKDAEIASLKSIKTITNWS